MSIWVFIISVALCLANEEASTCSTSYSPGPLTYTLGSTSETGYIIQAGGTNSWGTVTPSGSQVTIGLGPRFYLANACYSAFSPTVFEAIDLLGGSITFTVDLTNIGCGLDAAFYLTSMPGPDASSNGDYYCDANCVGGQCCPEMDLMEANRHALQVTAHKCTSATSGCDAGGCAVNTDSITNGYGPSTSYTINTLSAFTVKISFAEASSELSTITTVISQGSNSITLTHSSTNCGSGYLSAFGSSLGAGMVPVWSYWAGSMSWLDGDECSSDTPEVEGSFVFSNLIITGSEKETTGPAPTPVAPVAPGTLTCSTVGATLNEYWIEFIPPSTVVGADTTASILCTIPGETTTITYSCTWYSYGKYECAASEGCNVVTVYLGSQTCVLSPAAATYSILEDGSATTNLSSNQSLIIGVSVAAVVLVIIIVVLVVVFKKKNADQLEVA